MHSADALAKGTKQMGHAERKVVFPAASVAPQARETTLATRNWRSRVAVSALLRELRLLGSVEETDAERQPRPLQRLRRLIRRVVGARTVRSRAVAPPPELVITADWRIPGEGSRTVGRLRLDEPATRGGARTGRPSDARLRDADALLTALGDLGPEELESALRVVRRMRSLAGAA